MNREKIIMKSWNIFRLHFRLNGDPTFEMLSSQSSEIPMFPSTPFHVFHDFLNYCVFVIIPNLLFSVIHGLLNGFSHLFIYNLQLINFRKELQKQKINIWKQINTNNQTETKTKCANTEHPHTSTTTFTFALWTAGLIKRNSTSELFVSEIINKSHKIQNQILFRNLKNNN